VIHAGSVLYAMRRGQPPYPVRPSSKTGFFYEGAGGSVRFEEGTMVFNGADEKEQKGNREQRQHV
jgi:hypothetical protein